MWQCLRKIDFLPLVAKVAGRKGERGRESREGVYCSAFLPLAGRIAHTAYAYFYPPMQSENE